MPLTLETRHKGVRMLKLFLVGITVCVGVMVGQLGYMKIKLQAEQIQSLHEQAELMECWGYKGPQLSATICEE